jgi:hypothetical protein
VRVFNWGCVSIGSVIIMLYVFFFFLLDLEVWFYLCVLGRSEHDIFFGWSGEQRQYFRVSAAPPLYVGLTTFSFCVFAAFPSSTFTVNCYFWNIF